MTLLMSAPTWLLAIVFLLFVLAAIEDMWRLRIHDWVSAGIAVGAFVAIALDGPIVGLWENLLLFSLILAIGTLIFALGLLGGGDIKLLAASALWVDLDHGWKMLVAVALAGGVEMLIVTVIRYLPWPDSWRERGALLRRGEAIPYALAIGVGFAGISWVARL
ncbi:MAG: hypothetical protein H0W65_03795 [Sphingomonas sp.]|uniref:A24 family peptidase n=1 Tax=Sphingomonas sp. TaxID=28214 RepID=UPI0017F2DB94|nr:prepilin peptidase [Sphingomonas sp.]MBA3666828.1 hypothetical protein [Sphingomonas sp.]